jgi:protein TonB
MQPSLSLSHQLAPSPGLMARVGLWVVGLHALALWLWVVGVQPLEIIKRPDISIEFFAPPAVQAVAAQEEQPNASPSQSTQPAPPTPRQQPAAQPRAQSEPQPTAQIQQPATEQPAAAEAPPTPPTPSTAPAAQPATQAVMQTASTADADYKAAYLNNPKPPYPAAAVRRGAEGRVVLLAEVLADGRAGRVQLEQSSGHALLDAAAMNTVRVWRFTPARKDGVIVTQTVRIPIEFNLREAR